MIDIGPLHIGWVNGLWMIAALHGVWSRQRIFRKDLAQLRYNRAHGDYGAIEDFGVRTVAESARSTALYAFTVVLGFGSMLIVPRSVDAGDDPSTLARVIGYGLVAMLWGFSFSDYVVRWVAAKLRHLDRPTSAQTAATAAETAAVVAHADAGAILEVGKQNLALSGVIHTLVNSQRTAMLQEQLASTKRELALLQEARADSAAIEIAEARITELEQELAKREATAEVAEAQMHAEKERADGAT